MIERRVTAQMKRFFTLIKLYIKHFCYKSIIFSQKLSFFPLNKSRFYGFMEKKICKKFFSEKANPKTYHFYCLNMLQNKFTLDIVNKKKDFERRDFFKKAISNLK